jgi:hypothetical protein
MRNSMVVVAAMAIMCLAMPAAADNNFRCKAARLLEDPKLIAQFCKKSAAGGTSEQDAEDESPPQGSSGDSSSQTSGGDSSSPGSSGDSSSQGSSGGDSSSQGGGGQSSSGSDSAMTPTPPPEEIDSPRGSFVQSCKDTQQDGWVVSATCKTISGETSQTKINFKNCPNHSLTNVNGNLVCGP